MTSDASGDPDDRKGVEFGWRVHAALDSWTGKVDSKASITLAIESAVLAYVLALSKNGERFSSLSGAHEWWHGIGIALLFASVLLSLLVVVPQLDRRNSRRQWKGNMIYFGHLRHWDPADLAKALGREQPYEDQLARQLVTMSKIAWRKHAALQFSLGFLVVGVACLIFVGA